MSKSTQSPLIVHIIYSLGVGGLENGLVNLINQMPKEAYRHVIICLKNATDFRQRIQREDVDIYELHKREGQDWQSFIAMYRLLRCLRPAIVHTRNLAALEYQLVAWLAGVRFRIHGEHGWDVFDPDGNNKKYQWLRRLLGVLIQRFIPLSKQLQSYLQDKVGIPAHKIRRICNGVDTNRFYPSDTQKQLADCPWDFNDGILTIGTVGRMHGVKDQMNLVNAFVLVLLQHPEWAKKIRLLAIGDGPLRDEALCFLAEKQLSHLAWLPGKRDDVAVIMRCLDIFVLPSQAEGISNTILEAMATGLPVIATRVGGNPELVDDGHTGFLVEKQNPAALADVLTRYIMQPELRQLHGNNGLQRVLDEFSMQAMMNAYRSVYDEHLKK